MNKPSVVTKQSLAHAVWLLAGIVLDFLTDLYRNTSPIFQKTIRTVEKPQAMRCLLTIPILLGTTATFAQPLLTAYHTAEPPQIDARLDDACWQAAIVTSPFVSTTGPSMPEEQTTARICWDEKRLYIGVGAFEGFLEPRLNMLESVPAKSVGEDTAVFADDCVDLFLKPPGDNSYRFAANSGTGTYDARNQDSKWDSGWQCVARRGRASYTLEMSIPLDALGAKPEGPWLLDIRRTRKAVEESSSWSGKENERSQASSSGTLEFTDTGPSLHSLAVEPIDEGYAVVAVIRGAADAASALGVTFDGGGEATTEWVTGPGRHRLSPAIPAKAAAEGTLAISYSLKQGDKLLARSPAIIRLLGLLTARLTLASQQARARAYLNGEKIAEGAETTLREGMNFVTISATADGEAPSLSPRLVVGPHVLQPAWLCRTDQPAGQWRVEMPLDDRWQPVSDSGKGIWAPDKAAAHFACAIYAGKRKPQLFPKLTTYYFPRGSKQLIRLYVHAPLSTPVKGYRMVVEAPAALEFIDVEPVSGGAPVVKNLGTVDTGEGKLTRWAINYDMLPSPGMELSMRWGDNDGNSLGYIPAIAAGGTFGWRHMTAEITPPAGSTFVHPLVIKWQNRGIVGSFWVDNVTMHQKGSNANLFPRGTFDDPGRPRSRIAPEGPDGSNCVKIVSSPNAADKQQAVWVDDMIPVDENKTYIVEMDVKCDSLRSPNAKPLCGLLMRAPKDLTEGEYPIRTWFEDLGGTVIEVPQQSVLQVLPPLKDMRPARARISPCYYTSSLLSDAVNEAYAENCRKSGITWTYGRIGNKVVEHLMPQGHKVFWSIGWHPYSAPAEQREFLEARPDLQAVDFDGKKQTHTFCPTWLLSEGDQVLQSLEARLLNVLATEPYAGANWDLEHPVVDPPTFCTCDRCLAAFRQFASIAADVEITTQTLLNEHRSAWVDFRCTQNAEMAGILRDMVHKADRPVEFSLYSGFQSTRTKEHYGVDWELMASKLDFGIAGYGGSEESIAATVEAMGNTPFMGGEMWYLSHRDDTRPAPKMETWRNRILRQYVTSGCKGCLIWWLASMDGGAFYATSEATAIIAEYEDYFVHEQRCDEKVEVEGIEPRNWAAFEKDGRVLVLLMNFGADTLRSSVTVGGKTHEVPLAGYGVEVLVVAGT